MILKKLSIFIPLFLTIVLAFSSIIAVSAQIIDQSNDVTRNGVANTFDWGQSFTPTMKYLYQVDLAILSSRNTKSYDVTINIRESWGGTILGSATTTVPSNINNNDIGEFTSFIFDPPIELTPGVLYIIQLPLDQYYHPGGTSDEIHWYSAEGDDTYPGGTAIQLGTPRDDDMVFRTFGSDQGPNPVGGFYTPVYKLNILTPYIALVGLIGAVSTIFVIVKKRKD